MFKMYVCFTILSFVILFISIISNTQNISDKQNSEYYDLYLWRKKYTIKSFSESNITLKYFPEYNFSMYIRKNHDHISNILRNGKIYNDCVKLYNIWSKTIPNEKDIFVDAGANIGTCSLFLMHYGIKTIAFEPVKDNLHIFTESLIKNKSMLNLITLYNIGLGSKKERRKMYCFNKNMGSSSILNKNNSSFIVDVYIDRLDEVINSYNNIHLLKIDVEGYEFEVIKGSKLLLQNGVIDFIFIEINCNILKVNPIEIYNYLELYNYTSNRKYYCKKHWINRNVLFYRRDILDVRFNSIINSEY